MAIPPRTRKRVRAIPRAADGSAFQKCDMCGNSVAIALADMHECQSSQEVKRFKGIRASQSVREDAFLDQPRSAFCFFTEEFKLNSASVDPIEIDREGFRTWKNMSEEERKPYVKEAAYVNFLYDKALRQGEADQFPKPDVEATKTWNEWEDCSGSWDTYMPEEGEEAKLDKKSDSLEEVKATTAKKSDSGCIYHEDLQDSLFWETLYGKQCFLKDSQW